MCRRGVIVLLCVYLFSDAVYGDNTTLKYPSDRFEQRTNRLFSFNTSPEDKIDVELDFSVPFLSIPVKANGGNGHGFGNGPLANFNLGAVALAGLMAFGAAVVVPTTYHLFEKLGATKPEEYNFNFNRFRKVDSTSNFWQILSSVDRALTEHNIDTTSCTQRVLCWMVHNANARMVQGDPTSTDKIIDGLATNSWVHQIVSGSVFQAAINSGLRGVNCTEEYNQCSVNQDTIQRLSFQLADRIRI